MPKFDGTPYTQLTSPARGDVHGVIKDVSEALPENQTKYATHEDLHQFGSWSSKVRSVTASGTVTIANTDPMFVEIDPNGSDRNVNFPAKSDDNHGYYMRHSGSANTLTLKRSGGATITTLTAGEVKYIMPSTLNDFIVQTVGAAASSDGWVAVSGTWTYASSTTITVASGAASIYDVGDPIRWKQGGSYKYAYIVAVADTLLTIRAGSAYSVANSAITDMYYSKGATPNGFPQSFALTAPTWTSSGTGFTNQPPTNSYSFSMKGKQVYISGGSTMHATSGATGVFTATFTTGQLPVCGLSSTSSSLNISTSVGGWSYIPATSIAVYMAKDDSTALATNSQSIVWSISYFV